MAAGTVTPQSWAESLLQALGDPTTTANVDSIVGWETMEGGNWHNTASYNPLNTTEPMPGASDMNSVGVKAYTSWSQGLDATVKVLHNGRYGDILSALRSGQGLDQPLQGLSTWSGGGYDRVTPSNTGGGAGTLVSSSPLASLVGSGGGSSSGPHTPGFGLGSVGHILARAGLYLVFLGGALALVVLGLSRVTGTHVPVPIPV